MDTIRSTGEQENPLPNVDQLGPGAIKLYDLIDGDQEQAGIGIRHVARVLLSCCDDENDSFYNYPAWPCECIGVRCDISARIFLEFLLKHAYEHVKVPILRLLARAKILAELDSCNIVENRYINRVLCAYYSSFDSRFQALFYPASYARFASAESTTFEFSSFLSEFVGLFAMPRINMNTLWISLNTENGRAPSLFCDFLLRIGEKPAISDKQSHVKNDFDDLDKVINKIIPVREYMHSAESALMVPYSGMCYMMEPSSEISELVFDVIGIENPLPASMEDVVDICIENMIEKERATGAFGLVTKHEHMRQQWSEYCKEVFNNYAILRNSNGKKERSMPSIIVNNDVVALISGLLSTGECTVGEAMAMLNIDDIEHSECSLLGSLPFSGKQEFIHILIAYAACIKSAFVNDGVLMINAEDIVFAYKAISHHGDAKRDEDQHVALDAFIDTLSIKDFVIPDQIAYDMSGKGSHSICADDIFKTASDFMIDDDNANPVPCENYALDQNALPLLSGAYIISERTRSFLGHENGSFNEANTYYDALLIACSLDSTRSITCVADKSDIFFAVMHEPVFDPASIDLTLSSPVTQNKAKTRVILRALPSPDQKPIQRERTRIYLEPGETPNLDKFCDDLTAQVKDGLGEGIVCRQGIIDKIETILMRKDKSNPVLLAPAGSGKTAIVEAFAKTINDKTAHVPVKRVVALNTAALVDGGANSNVIAERISAIAQEAIATSTVLFIDELHMITSIGSHDFDVANMLKPYLARSGLRVIGATTEKEYNSTIRKDRALDRRFDAVHVPAMGFEDVVMVINAKKKMYGSFHGVTYSDSAPKTIALMAQDYMSTRTSPDRELDILDVSSAIAQKEKEQVVRENHIIEAVKVLTSNTNVRSRRQMAMEAQDGSIEEHEAFSEIAGQARAKKKIAERLALSRIAISASKRPANVMLFAGESGVGKTYMAHQIARVLDLGEDDVLEISLGDYQSKGSHTTLLGAPPSFIGYDDGGILVNFATSHPCGIVVLDEMDKCVPEILDVFLGIFDTGILQAANGTTADCSSMTFICTANIGFGSSKRHSIGFSSESSKDAEDEMALDSIKEKFGAPLISRMDEIVLFDPLTNEDLEEVCRINYAKMAKDISIRYDMELANIIGFDEVLEKLSPEISSSSDIDARVLGRKCEAIVTESVFSSFTESNDLH